MPHSLFEIVKMHKTTQLPPRTLALINRGCICTSLKKDFNVAISKSDVKYLHSL